MARTKYMSSSQWDALNLLADHGGAAYLHEIVGGRSSSPDRINWETYRWLKRNVLIFTGWPDKGIARIMLSAAGLNTLAYAHLTPDLRMSLHRWMWRDGVAFLPPKAVIDYRDREGVWP